MAPFFQAQLIAGILPSLALEARISGGGNPIGDQLVTQLGLSVQAAQHVDMAILGEEKIQISKMPKIKKKFFKKI